MSTGPPRSGQANSGARQIHSTGSGQAGPPELKELLIASVTPQNLERGVLRFDKAHHEQSNDKHPLADNTATKKLVPSGVEGWFKENINSIKKARITNPWWRENSFILEKDLALKPSQLIRTLIDLGYERAEIPRGKGTFSIRGGIIEIWPINSAAPFLVEFQGNIVATISPSPPREEKIKPRITSRSIEKLPQGSYMVHVDHGIGIYRGVGHIDRGDQVDHTKRLAEYFVIEYAPARRGGEPDKLYVPAAEEKDRLSPYVGFETPKVHHLGESMWQTTKRKTREDVEVLARALLALYAVRESSTRAARHGDPELEATFRSHFTYVETEDQSRAEEEIMRDFEKTRPMDRILCGDVGFGKTEIALRALLRAVTSGTQATLLSPTTVLAAQHFETCAQRFAGLPIRIALLSRHTPAHELASTKKGIADGSIDVVIATHRILSSDITFKNLGLAVIDEEQRFGVKQKERFKEMRKEIDILSLSATPIPRTLSLSLARLRDISRIETPPLRRLPIATAVLPHSKHVIKSALQFEIGRGGQIYYLHNRIETIGSIKKMLLSLKISSAPRIEVLHGRMSEQEAMRAMRKFRDGECDVLLATTIIENGLDISSANTLIVDDAARLGLAEAHQLRGRIGRGTMQAFAYFLYRPRHMSEKAADRLEALEEYAALGAGYDIALRDLEIRGAGNILGREQSGAINKVGFNLYCQMLADAVEFEKNNRPCSETARYS